MASRDPLSMAQDVIRCTLCEDAPADLNCNTCHVGLCGGCVSQHITSTKSANHDIAPFITETTRITKPECQSHSKVKCDFYCRQCNTAVCSKCVTGQHRLHDFVEISEIHTTMIETIQKETQELETVIAEEYEKVKTETKSKLTKIQNEYQSLKESIVYHGRMWHKELDTVIAQVIEDVEKMEKQDLSILNKQLREMENILDTMRQIAQKNKKIIKTNNTTEIITYKSRNEELCIIPARNELSPPTFKALKIEGADLMKKFGVLTSTVKKEILAYKITMKESILSLTSVTQLLDVPTEVTTTNTEGVICNMTTANTDQMWIGKRNFLGYAGGIYRVDIHGTTLETINTFSRSFPPGLTVTQEGHLIYTDWRDKTVNLVRRGEIEIVIRTGDWRPSSVCSTSNGDLLVCLDKNKQKKVVRYSGYKVKQEIQHDEKNKPLFAEGGYLLFAEDRYMYLYIAENHDQNICVSDPNADTVLVLNQAGKLQFRYDGNLASNKYKSFTPRGIATDSQGQILIADCDNKCVHIINRDGKFLRYIDNCHLDWPDYLSVDSSDQLFVSHGSSSVKIIKYMN